MFVCITLWSNGARQQFTYRVLIERMFLLYYIRDTSVRFRGKPEAEHSI